MPNYELSPTAEKDIQQVIRYITDTGERALTARRRPPPQPASLLVAGIPIPRQLGIFFAHLAVCKCLNTYSALDLLNGFKSGEQSV